MKIRPVIAASLCSLLCTSVRAAEPTIDRDWVCSDAYADKLIVAYILATNWEEPREESWNLSSQYSEDLRILDDAVAEEKVRQRSPKVCEYTRLFFDYQMDIRNIQEEMILYKESYMEEPMDILTMRSHTDGLDMEFDDLRRIKRTVQYMNSAQLYDPNDLIYSIDVFLKQELLFLINEFQTVRSAAEKITRLSVEQLNRNEVDYLIFAGYFLKNTADYDKILRSELAFEMENWEYTAARAMTKWGEDLATTTKILPEDIVLKRAMLKELQGHLNVGIGEPYMTE